MTLNQFHALKLWHTRHCRDAPLEKNVWDLVLMVWLAAGAGLPAVLLLGLPLVGVGCVALLFLPRAYVAWRTRLHRNGTLRCDWISALR